MGVVLATRVAKARASVARRERAWSPAASAPRCANHSQYDRHVRNVDELSSPIARIGWKYGLGAHVAIGAAMRERCACLLVAVTSFLVACSSSEPGGPANPADESGRDASLSTETGDAGTDALFDARTTDAAPPTGPLCERAAPSLELPVTSTCAEGAGSFIPSGAVEVGRYHLASATTVRGNVGQCGGYASATITGKLDITAVGDTHYEFIEVRKVGDSAPVTSRWIAKATGEAQFTLTNQCGTTTVYRGDMIATPTSLTLIESGDDPMKVVYEM